MKQIGRSITAAAVLALGIAAGGRAANPKGVISTNVFNLAVATFSVEYEHMLNPKSGIYGLFRYGSFKIGDYETSWPGFSVGYHMYPGGKSPEGMFWGPLLYANIMTTTFEITTFNLTTFATTTSKEEVTATFFGPMVDLGYRWNWGGFTLAPSFQIGFLTGELKDSTGLLELDYGGFAWGLGLNAGYAF